MPVRFDTEAAEELEVLAVIDEADPVAVVRILGQEQDDAAAILQ
jgi:hypothetical protein